MKSPRLGVLAVLVVLVACQGGRSDPGLSAREDALAEADPTRASIPHPDDGCDELAEPARWAEAGTPDVGAQPPLVSAHRGAHYLAPENTLWAYRHAFAYGADVVEVDVRESLDGVFFSLHDSTLDRTTDGSGEAALRSWDQLATLNAAAFEPWIGGPYDPSPIPRLEEIFALAAEVGGGVEMDIKFVRNYLSLILLLEQYGLVEQSYYAANGLGADAIRLVQGRARFIYNASGEESPEELYAQTAQSSVFGSRLARFSAEAIAAIHDGCMLVVPHSYDEGPEQEESEWDAGRARGMDGAQTDQPDRIRARQAAVDPRRRLPTVLEPSADGRQICLRNAFNGLGLPQLPLELSDGRQLQTGIDGCVLLPAAVAQLRPRFAGAAALFPSAWAD